MNRQINDAGLALIKEFEGTKLTRYKDAAGLWTIGTGHLIRPGEHFTTITQEQSDALLREDLKTAEAAVNSSVTVPITDNQFAALVSLTFNIGSGAFKRSTLLKHLNAGKYALASEEFRKWNRAGGRVLKGLARRREAERDLFLTLKRDQSSKE